MIFETLIKNELNKILGREPTLVEVKLALTYVSENFDYDLTIFSDVSDMLEDWRANNCFKCSECGKYFLEDDLYHEEKNDKMCKDCYWDEDVAYARRVNK